MDLTANITHCYQSDNNFAYKYDRYLANQTIANQQSVLADLKLTNFVLTYDTWCLYCNNKIDVTKRCAGCHAVYFCDEKCQRKAWPLHKKHCQRDLFTLCIQCGVSVKNKFLRCEACPVKFCSQQCRQLIYTAHKDYDCAYLAKTFKS